MRPLDEFCTIISRGPAALTSDGALLVLVELAFDKAQHQAGLSHCRFAQQHQLELADLAARRCAVGPLCSASPCHGTALEMWDEEGRTWCTGGLERLAAEAGEGRVRPSEVAAGSVQICRQEEMRPHQRELEKKTFIRLCVK